jgi:hypothetical protein
MRVQVQVIARADCLPDAARHDAGQTAGRQQLVVLTGSQRTNGRDTQKPTDSIALCVHAHAPVCLCLCRPSSEAAAVMGAAAVVVVVVEGCTL